MFALSKLRAMVAMLLSASALAPIFLCETTSATDGGWRGLTSGLRSLLHFEVPDSARISLPYPPKVLVKPTGPDADNFSRPHHPHDLDPEAALRRRCALVKGTWCGEFLRQVRLPARPVPRGSKECPNACSGWGNCNYDTGICECPAGHGGDDCSKPVKRPCAHGHRNISNPNATEPVSSVGPDGQDIGPTTVKGWTASRCFGFCDDDVAACYCGEGRYRRIPAPPGSPPWTPPVQHGRPLADGCQPATDATGARTFAGGAGTSWDDIYGPQGFCNAPEKAARQAGREGEGSPDECGCFQEVAFPCDGSVPMETTCMNQCSGHGECHFGFCRCHKFWYGSDCSRKKADSGPLEPALHEGERPWLRPVVAIPPAAQEVPAISTRPRPLIYVYDVPPEYTSRMLQYRNFGDTCLWRRWYNGNHTGMNSYTYGIETLLHEMMLQSEHRTFDPEEADFFHVPMYITCYFWPIMGWSDGPWWHAPNGLRVMHGANMISELHGWLQTKLPYWNRRGGRDHIWLMAHDEGACWMPKAVYDTSIVLTHWGRLDPDHTSNTAYLQDNYTSKPEAAFDAWRGVDFGDRIKGHPCYDPNKDLVIPAFKNPNQYPRSPLLGAPPLERDVLLFFRGDVGAGRLPHYSRGIRQKLFHLANKHDWYGRFKIAIGTGDSLKGDYSEQLARSKFCLVAPGDGWSPRAEDAILHGCIPVVVMDGVQAVFESILDWDSFSIRIREDDAALEALPQLLSAVSPERLAHMQRHLSRVWHRFAYTQTPFIKAAVEHTIKGYQHKLEKAREEVLRDAVFQPVSQYPHADDAFGTIMQWLYHRIPHTRGA
ncbi:hypothetical protein HYH02_008672 [Chlamydomonas schloesseri]|uniref:EGF-like domain-containing protein n=1 Tax=Chlamydomonas schloesseri TaxID=2026947 RepID=A0A835WDC5_9CHLO|nr:hypothetical protein HYH02_008672 [Chlamydomonas schloesseri]|eukprot:KAG2445204.1 hypothetical protein HYH02_008672 [Chlamydomonas schloesseri]